ncbi:zinc finger protein 33B-like [Anoplophora glabripennis]|uniref:zinc finger protein 33B-like n=1 Tax=Anoplophora glabripennis TaxID=217634 RepID=UPI00087550E1|nr:zinc finger protein 33B-like [Anoplophora glabripennis]
MSGLQETLCRLCRTIITDKSFEVIDNATRDILHVLLLKLKLDGESKEVICNACRRKLHAALEFKSTCLNNDNTIIPNMDSEQMLQLHIREVYTKEKGSESMDISDSQKICRLCMQPKSEFKCISEEEHEAIQKLIPEMDINIIKEPVVCKPCFDSLCTHNLFLREVEEKIKCSFDSPAIDIRIDKPPTDLFFKTEDLDSKFDINEMEMSIKTECVNIKDEDEETSDTLSSDNESFQKSDWKDAQGCKHENGSGNECNSTTKAFSTSHQLMHEYASQVKMYMCNDCNYKTKYRSYIIKHQLKHKDPSQVKMYKCTSCDYETKYKHSFKHHELKHKDPSQVQVYRCDKCDYKTIYKNYVKQHQLRHKESSQDQVYRCNDCNYQTKYKGVMTAILKPNTRVPLNSTN